jgi:hypothetical protein
MVKSVSEGSAPDEIVYDLFRLAPPVVMADS